LTCSGKATRFSLIIQRCMRVYIGDVDRRLTGMHNATDPSVLRAKSRQRPPGQQGGESNWFERAFPVGFRQSGWRSAVGPSQRGSGGHGLIEGGIKRLVSN